MKALDAKEIKSITDKLNELGGKPVPKAVPTTLEEQNARIEEIKNLKLYYPPGDETNTIGSVLFSGLPLKNDPKDIPLIKKAINYLDNLSKNGTYTVFIPKPIDRATQGVIEKQEQLIQAQIKIADAATADYNKAKAISSSTASQTTMDAEINKLKKANAEIERLFDLISSIKGVMVYASKPTTGSNDEGDPVAKYLYATWLLRYTGNDKYSRLQPLTDFDQIEKEKVDTAEKDLADAEKAATTRNPNADAIAKAKVAYGDALLKFNEQVLKEENKQLNSEKGWDSYWEWLGYSKRLPEELKEYDVSPGEKLDSSFAEKKRLSGLKNTQLQDELRKRIDTKWKGVTSVTSIGRWLVKWVDSAVLSRLLTRDLMISFLLELPTLPNSEDELRDRLARSMHFN